MGIWHQMLKNLFNVPVVSPYQTPCFLNELFYRFDPYFVNNAGDVRAEIGRILFGGPVEYPLKNKPPDVWKRDRFLSIPLYINRLRSEKIFCCTNFVRSWMIGKKERVLKFIDTHSCKRRTVPSRLLFPLRCWLGRAFPAIRIKRHDIAATEIR